MEIVKELAALALVVAVACACLAVRTPRIGGRR